ncbi:MAG: archaellin/type IV pilin N-terminal domain-containing protein [Thermoproteota archaeon]
MPGFRKAISPLLATVILIAITVAGGLLVYNVFFNTAGTVSTQLNIQVVSVDIIRTSTTTLVSATIKNTGNKPITSCTVTIYGDSGSVSLSLGAIDVGQSKSASQTNPSSFSVTVGKAYPVKIDATASDGSTLSKSLTVTCVG